MRRGLYERVGKRALDVAVSSVALVALSPLLLVVAMQVYRRLGSPVFFRQQRPGQRGQPFTLVKFRTMTSEADELGQPLPDEQRLPAFGRWLRASSLDELPELWNVIKGDMSLVGPRPLLMSYLPLYSDEESRRHDVRPGVTGLAQVNGRNAMSWNAKFAMDVWYVDHVSLALDARILLHTLGSVFRREGISADGHATAPPFTG